MTNRVCERMRLWTARVWTAVGDGAPLGLTVRAASERSARTKIERQVRSGVGRVYIDEEAEANNALPCCPCGWQCADACRGCVERGARCPACGGAL